MCLSDNLSEIQSYEKSYPTHGRAPTRSTRCIVNDDGAVATALASGATARDTRGTLGTLREKMKVRKDTRRIRAHLKAQKSPRRPNMTNEIPRRGSYGGRSNRVGIKEGTLRVQKLSNLGH